MPRQRGKQIVYAVYRGDDFIDVGTGPELVARLGIKRATLYFLASPACKKWQAGRKGNKKRWGWDVVKIDDDEEEAL